MKIYSKYETDEKAEIEGTWIDLGDGAKIKIARLQNPRHREVLENLQKPFALNLRAGVKIPEADARRTGDEAIAKTILLDWQGIEDNQGNPIPYTEANAFKVLTDLKEFREVVVNLAFAHDTFRKEVLEQAAKNSAPPSAGGSSNKSTNRSST